MPVSPDIGSQFAGPVADLLAEQELKLLEQAALALRGNQDRDGWEAAALARIVRWRDQADRGVVGALAELGRAVREALLGATAEGEAMALVDLPGTKATPPSQARGVYLSEARLGSQLAAALQQSPRLLESVLREAVRAGVDQVRGGTATRRTGAQQVLDRLVRQGVTGFRDSAGRNWSLTSYAEMAVRTETQARALAAGDATIRATGLDRVIVSDSPRECPVCRPFEGKILTMDGTGSGSLSYARSKGFQHPNCTHSYSGYVPGVTKRKKPDSNPDGYEEKQHQRYLERKVREWKRAEVLALDPQAQAQARTKVRQWQGALRNHVETNGLKRQPGRESITRAV